MAVLERGRATLGFFVRRRCSNVRTQWNDRIFNGGPQNEAAQQRFQSRIAEVAAKRGMSVEQLSSLTRWVDIIELDEGRI